MKSSLSRWFGRAPDLGAVLVRFPVAVGLMAIFTVIIIFYENFGDNDSLGRMLAGLIIGAYLAFSITIARETKGKSPAYILQIALAVIIAAITWFSKELRFNLPMAIGAVLLILGNMVLWRKARDDLHVWDFTHKIWTGAVFATVGSIIFTLGVFAIQAALKSLFGVNINELTERLILPIALGFLAPLYWLSTAPKTDESYQDLYENPGFVSKAVAFMGTWLLSPLTLIYALILIAYAVKIIMAGSLPKGEIAQLTTPFLFVGTLTWLVLEPPFIKNKALAKLFRKLWFPLSVPAAIMLAISVGVRIGEYGFTPERLALLMAVIWALGLGVWFTFGPNAKRDIRLIPGSAAVLLVIGAFGFEWLSLTSQKSRAVEGMKSAGIMSESGVIRPLEDIRVTDKDAARKAKGALAYLARQGEQAVLAKLFEGAEKAPAFEKYDNSDLFTRLALTDVVLNVKRTANTHYRYAAPKGPMSISEYDTIYGQYKYYARRKGSQNLSDDGPLKISGKNQRLEFKMNGENISSFDLEEWIAGVPTADQKLLIEDPLLVIFDQDKQKIAIRILSANSWRSDIEGDSQNVNIEFLVLTKGF